MTQVMIAPDSFKGSLTARQAADAIERGVLRADPAAVCVKVPMADGGEGTVQSLVDATSGTWRDVEVTGPLGTAVHARYGLLGDGRTAVMEMAAASGIQFVSDRTRDPLRTTTFGTGQMLADALDHGAENVIIGLGGSATNDGGAGMAQALGVRLLDGRGQDLPWGGAALRDLARIDVSRLDPRLRSVSIRLACDVTNPLVGPEGASCVFGPQKGADTAMVARLDRALSHYAQIVESQLGRSVAHRPGAGAAGGLGAGFMAFTDAVMQSGVELVVDATGLKDKARGVDVCFTGEGAIDSQTRYGKTPMGVARAVKEVSPGCRVVALAGCVGEGIETLYGGGIDAVFGILPKPCALRVAMEEGEANLERCAENVMRMLR